MEQKNNSILRGMEEVLELYDRLLGNIESYAERLYKQYGEYLTCKPGCSECCILGSVNGIEAYGIAGAVKELPKESGERIGKNAGEDRCIFLYEDQCLIYNSRPVICRTHGYPLYIEESVDFCPKNFTGLDTIDSGYILNLDALNKALASINISFIALIDDPFYKQERISLRELCGRGG
ncbi:MAG: YkgJ family cysteine cluster protein [bacterium]|nr:YkgJ family cysteine cluster protein [bacterium]